MKLLSGGVGIDAMTISNLHVRLYGNEAFMTAHKGTGLRLGKMRRVEKGWDVEFIRDPDGNIVGQDKDYFRWMAATPPKLPMRRFGKTEIIDIREHAHGFVVTLPEVLRPNHRMVKGDGTPTAKPKRVVTASPELPFAAPAPAEKPSPEIAVVRNPQVKTATEFDRMYGQATPAEPTLHDLQLAVRLINTFVAANEGSIVLSVEGGKLKAMMEVF